MHCACSNSVNFTHYGALKAHSWNWEREKWEKWVERMKATYCSVYGSLFSLVTSLYSVSSIRPSLSNRWVLEYTKIPMFHFAEGNSPSNFRTIINEWWIKLKLCFSWSKWMGLMVVEKKYFIKQKKYSFPALDENKMIFSLFLVSFIVIICSLSCSFLWMMWNSSIENYPLCFFIFWGRKIEEIFW